MCTQMQEGADKVVDMTTMTTEEAIAHTKVSLPLRLVFSLSLSLSLSLALSLSHTHTHTHTPSPLPHSLRLFPSLPSSCSCSQYHSFLRPARARALHPSLLLFSFLFLPLCLSRSPTCAFSPAFFCSRASARALCRVVSPPHCVTIFKHSATMRTHSTCT